MAKQQPPSLVEAVQSGDERKALEAMRDALATHMAAAEPNVVAQIAGRLQVVIERLATMPAGAEAQTKADELRARRQKRRGAA